jgi:arabinose-5-phosphate isomerase
MIIDIAKKVLEIEAESVKNLINRLDKNFEQAVYKLHECKGRVVLTGMGKSGIICKKISGTFSSIGISSFFLHPAEAIHGDIGMVKPNDIIIAVSNSGETEELIKLLELIKRLGIIIIAMTGDLSSTLARHSDIVIDVSVDKEACPFGLTPTSSTTAALAMGDALAMALLNLKEFKEEDFLNYHPAGSIGRKVLKVENLMHTGDEVPKVYYKASMRDAIKIMSAKKLGVTSVVDSDDTLMGIITDGDLRRLLEKYYNLLDKTAGECMTTNPKTIDKKELAVKALNLMEKLKITSLLIVTPDNKIEGIIHIHDLWRTQLF